MRSPFKYALAVALAVGPMMPVGASAAPVQGAVALKDAAPASIEHVQWRGHWRDRHGSRHHHRYYRHRDRGAGVAAGLAAGALIGGAIAASRAQAANNAYAYCSQRYRSYDPRSGTYLGYDGYRHPCP